MAEWLVLSPRLEVCDNDTRYEGGERRRGPWWLQTSAKNQLIATLKKISAAARERHWKSVRRGGSRGDRDAEESEDGAGRDVYQNAGMGTGDDKVV